MKSREQILLEENELKPNRYSSKVIAYMMLGILFVNLVNELGFFYVDHTKLRICCLIEIVCTGIAFYLGKSDRIAAKRSTKYGMILLIFAETLTITVILPQWTELMIAMPIMLGMQYHNKTMTRIAMVGTLVIALICAPLSIYLEVYQQDYYLFLINSIGWDFSEVLPRANYDVCANMVEIFKFVSIPRCLFVTAFGLISVYITEQTSVNIRHRVDATYYSTTDIMTGLRNRFSFEEKTEEYRRNRPEKLICVYADADGLHGLNNAHGHAAGDEFLKNCAKQMSENFGEMTYRLGGDEFFAFVDSGSVEEAEEKKQRICTALREKDYHMSIGISALREELSIDDMIKEAEAGMYAVKRAYYSEDGKNRRKH